MAVSIGELDLGIRASAASAVAEIRRADAEGVRASAAAESRANRTAEAQERAAARAAAAARRAAAEEVAARQRAEAAKSAAFGSSDAKLIAAAQRAEAQHRRAVLAAENAAEREVRARERVANAADRSAERQARAAERTATAAARAAARAPAAPGLLSRVGAAISANPFAQGVAGAVGGLGIAAGVTAGISALTSTIGSAITASGNFETSLRVLSATSRLTNTPLGQMQAQAAGVQRAMGLTTTTANMLTAAATRVTAAAGRTVDTGRFLTSWLDLAAARGLSASRAMDLLNSNILENDEAVNALGLSNPSVIYEKWAGSMNTTAAKMTDVQKAQAIVNEVIASGSRVTGEYASRMGGAAGAVERYNNAKENFLVALGQAITGTSAYGGVIGTFTGLLTSATGWVTAHRTEIGSLVSGLGMLATAFATVVGWIGRMSTALNAPMKYMPLELAMRAMGFGARGDAPPATGNTAALAGVLGASPFGGASPSTTGASPFGEVSTAGYRQFGADAVPTPTAGGAAETAAARRAREAAARRAEAARIAANEDAVNAQRGRLERVGTIGTTNGAAGLAGSFTNSQAGEARGMAAAQQMAARIVVNPRIVAPRFAQEVMRFTAETGRIISSGMAQGLSQSIQNSVAAAFDGGGVIGVIAAFGKTMLSAVGGIFVQLGETYLMYGGIMQGLAALLPNPFTAGFAGLAIGAALIALGSALNAVASGGGGGGRGGRGGGGGGGYAGPVVQDLTQRTTLAPRAAPVAGQAAPVGIAGTPATQRPVVIGTLVAMNPRDPQWNRMVAQSVAAADGRGIPTTR